MAQILLIEDDVVQGECYGCALRKAGHEVCATANGRQALRLLHADSFMPSLVLTDIAMPEMNGLEVIEYFRTHHPEIPLVAMSGDTASGYLVLARKLGAKAVLEKPIRQELLLRTIDSVIGQACVQA